MLKYPYSESEVKMLSGCSLCPRSCNVNRFSTKLGYCNSNSGFNISSICCHKGEEPVISGKKGICNIFFSHCNLQCIYCQNYHISCNTESVLNKELKFDDVIDQICEILEETENIVGFVSPSHRVPQVLAIIRGLHKAGKHPIFVYNTNGYEKVETIRLLEGLIDVYLPDIKYSDPKLANEYSDAPNYPETAFLALKEMIRQKGTSLIINDRGIAVSGIIIRHLVLPGHADQSIQIFRNLEEQFSIDLHFSIMSQYYPTPNVLSHRILGRTITLHEYSRVIDAFHELGFYRGWLQDLESHSIFQPDFFNEDPFGT